MPNYREQLREAIEKNGGYHANRESYALAWNVKMYKYPDLDNVLKACVDNFFISEGDMVMRYPDIRDKAVELMEKTDGVCRWAQESMCESLNDSDVYKMISSEVAERFNYQGKEGQETPFDMEFGFAGRSCGYVVVDEFEGRKGDRLLDYLDEDEIKEEDPREEAWAQRMLCLIAECDKMFESNAVHREFEYQIGWQIGQALETEKEEA